MISTSIEKMFERRQFTTKEREQMQELYARAKMLAQDISKVVPYGIHVDFAILKLKECLAYVETAVALSVPCDKQMEMPLTPAGELAEAKMQHLKQRCEELEKERAFLMMKLNEAKQNEPCNAETSMPGYARR